MPVSVHHKNGLRTQFLDKQLMTTGKGSRLTPKQISNIKKWTTRYRRNWDLFTIEVLQIKLHDIQKMVIHMMGVSDEFFDIATRGAAKSFDVAIGAMCEFCLKPYSEIVITSSTLAQAGRLVESKIKDEIIKKLSAYLLYMYEKEYITITKSSTSEGGAYRVENKLNGSIIMVLPCLDSSRGPRSTLNIYEEARLLKKSLIDSVFEPMGHARQAKYLTNPKYNVKRWQEKARSIYITSAGYYFEWFSKKFRDTVTQYYISKHEKYIPFAQDIFAAIAEGSRTWSDYRKNKKTLSEMTFRIEIMNEMFRETENAFFTMQSFKQNQELVQNWKPPTDIDFLMQKDIGNKPKDDNEIRLVVTDYAFANTTSKQANDNTIILCMSMHWKKNRFERHVDYIEGWPASDSLGAVDRVREIFWDYEANYYVPDLRNGGETLYNRMTMPWDNPRRGILWNSNGLTVCDEKDLHVVPDNKINDLILRTVDKNAVPCIIPVIGTPELNSNLWMELKKQLEINNIKFLTDAQKYQEHLEDTGEYFDLTSEELANKLMPFAQTELLIKEATELQAELKEGKIKLSEPRSGTKDRAICLAYGNYIASKIENKWQRLMVDPEDVNIDDIQLVW